MERDFVRLCTAILISLTVYLIGGLVYTYCDMNRISSVLSVPCDIIYFLSLNQVILAITVGLGVYCRGLFRLKKRPIYGFLFLLFQFYSLLSIYGVVDEFWAKGTRFSRWELRYDVLIFLFTLLRLWAFKRKHGSFK